MKYVRRSDTGEPGIVIKAITDTKINYLVRWRSGLITIKRVSNLIGIDHEATVKESRWSIYVLKDTTNTGPRPLLTRAADRWTKRWLENGQHFDRTYNRRRT